MSSVRPKYPPISSSSFRSSVALRFPYIVPPHQSTYSNNHFTSTNYNFNNSSSSSSSSSSHPTPHPFAPYVDGLPTAPPSPRSTYDFSLATQLASISTLEWHYHIPSSGIYLTENPFLKPQQYFGRSLLSPEEILDLVMWMVGLGYIDRRNPILTLPVMTFAYEWIARHLGNARADTGCRATLTAKFDLDSKRVHVVLARGRGIVKGILHEAEARRLLLEDLQNHPEVVQFHSSQQGDQQPSSTAKEGESAESSDAPQEDRIKDEVMEDPLPTPATADGTKIETEEEWEMRNIEIQRLANEEAKAKIDREEAENRAFAKYRNTNFAYQLAHSSNPLLAERWYLQSRPRLAELSYYADTTDVVQEDKRRLYPLHESFFSDRSNEWHEWRHWRDEPLQEEWLKEHTRGMCMVTDIEGLPQDLQPYLEKVRRK